MPRDFGEPHSPARMKKMMKAQAGKFHKSLGKKPKPHPPKKHMGKGY